MNDSIVKKAISVITVLICVYAVYFFRDLFGYLLISVGLSFAGRPIVDLVSKVKIKGKSLSSSIGAIIAMTCFILAGAVVIGLCGPLISTQAEALAAIDTQQLAGDLKGWVAVIDQITRQLDLGHDSFSSLILDSTVINSLGWKSEVNLDTGLELTYKWFLKNI